MRYYAIAALLAFLGTAIPAVAADVPARPVQASPELAQEAARHYVSQRAVLFMIRATYGVISSTDVPALLAADVRAVGTAGPTERDTAELRRDLIAEGSYFLISLRYLAESGGANWPGDRAEAMYSSDATVTVDTLLDHLFDAVDAGEDVLPIMQQVDELYFLTEGVHRVEGDLDHFAGRDELVDDAFLRAGIRSGT
jgi:hypothetical protein